MALIGSSMPLLCREVDVRVSGRALHLAYSSLHQQNRNEWSDSAGKTALIAFLVGSKPICINNERVVIILDRLDLGRSVATGADSRPIKIPTVFSNGDWALPVEFSMGSQPVAHTHTFPEYTAALQSLVSHVTSHAPVDVGQLLVGRGTCTFDPGQQLAGGGDGNGGDSDVAFALCCNVVTFSSSFEVLPTRTCDLHSNPLLRDLTSKDSGWLWLEPQFGYIFRASEPGRYQLTLFYDQPALEKVHLCGIWVSGIDKVSHPAVWSACQRFINSNCNLHTVNGGDYMLLLFNSPTDPVQCYHWRASSQNDRTSSAFSLLGCCHRAASISRQGAVSVTLHEMTYGAAHTDFKAACQSFQWQSRSTVGAGVQQQSIGQVERPSVVDHQPRDQVPQPHERKPKIAQAAVTEVSLFFPPVRTQLSADQAAVPGGGSCQQGYGYEHLPAGPGVDDAAASQVNTSISTGLSMKDVAIAGVSSLPEQAAKAVRNERIEEWLAKQKDAFDSVGSSRAKAHPVRTLSSALSAPSHVSSVATSQADRHAGSAAAAARRVVPPLSSTEVMTRAQPSSGNAQQQADTGTAPGWRNYPASSAITDTAARHYQPVATRTSSRPVGSAAGSVFTGQQYAASSSAVTESSTQHSSIRNRPSQVTFNPAHLQHPYPIPLPSQVAAGCLESDAFPYRALPASGAVAGDKRGTSSGAESLVHDAVHTAQPVRSHSDGLPLRSAAAASVNPLQSSSVPQCTNSAVLGTGSAHTAAAAHTAAQAEAMVAPACSAGAPFTPQRPRTAVRCAFASTNLPNASAESAAGLMAMSGQFQHPGLFSVSPVAGRTPLSRVHFTGQLGNGAAAAAGGASPSAIDGASPESQGSLGTIKGPPASSVSQQCVPASNEYFRTEEDLQRYEQEKLCRMMIRAKENACPVPEPASHVHAGYNVAAPSFASHASTATQLYSSHPGGPGHTGHPGHAGPSCTDFGGSKKHQQLPPQCHWSTASSHSTSYGVGSQQQQMWHYPQEKQQQQQRQQSAPPAPRHLQILEPNLTMSQTMDVNLSYEVEMIARKRLGDRQHPPLLQSAQCSNDHRGRQVQPQYQQPQYQPQQQQRHHPQYQYQARQQQQQQPQHVNQHYQQHLSGSQWSGGDSHHGTGSSITGRPAQQAAATATTSAAVRKPQGSILNVANMTLGTRSYMSKYGLIEDGDGINDITGEY
ncbi:AF4/FMR2 family member lilli-like [Sycon ciliatum]|uniref:AF4/FMR2 family member lilli-like n=1 Tax=Sycon ciliatum TaxID=27933 RepID=UPI0031F631AF